MGASELEFYVRRSIDRRWKIELANVPGPVLVFSPFLTSRTAELVLQHADPGGCEVHTVFRALNFASGASSIQTFRRLLGRGYSLFHLPNLHAKMVLAPGAFASIGSQNITLAGTKNKEATALFFDKQHVRKLQGLVEDWFRHRTRITIEMISDMEALLPDLVAAFREVTSLAADADSSVRKTKRARDFAEPVKAVRQRLQELFPHDGISRFVAADLVRASAWWVDHPYGPCRAPGDASRIQGDGVQWKLTLGANTFLVSSAALACRRHVERFLAACEEGTVIAVVQLKQWMRSSLRRSVANSQGTRYNGPYSHGRELKFGSHAIDIEDFVRQFLKMIGFQDAFENRDRNSSR